MKWAIGTILAFLPSLAFASLDVPPIYVLANQTAKSSSTNIVTSNWTVSASAFLGTTVVAPSAGFAMAFDSATAPANGVVAPGGCWVVPAPGTSVASMVGMANTPAGVALSSGSVTVVFSTGADCLHLVASNAFITIIYAP